MLITNGSILVSQTNNIDELDEAIGVLETYMHEEKGIKCNFEVFQDEQKGYPFYKIPKEVKWDDLDHVLRPSIKLRAINESKLIVGTPFDRKFKRTYSDEERADIAKELASNIMKKETVELEKKASMSQFKTRIENIETEIHEQSKAVTEGFEWKDYQVYIKYDFEEKKKYFYEVGTDELLGYDELESEDYQLRIDHTYEESEEEEEDTELLEGEKPEEPNQEEDKEEDL